LDDLTALAIPDALRLLRAGDITAVELTSAHLARIAAVDTELASFVAVLREHALQTARELDRAWCRDGVSHPLHGVPVAVKDIFYTSDAPTTMGSRLFADDRAITDGHVVGRLKAAGAVLLGKLNMDEFALGVTGINPLFPRCRNPWDVDRIPGGSSGGSASALAASLCMGALGTDTAGSIRVPAALCGVVGFKPTFGHVSRRGVIPLSWSLDHVGPMARSVEEVGLLFAAIVGYDAGDPFSVRCSQQVGVPREPTAVRGWKIGLAVDGRFGGADAHIIEAVEAGAQTLESLGASVDAVTIDADVPGGIITTEGAVLHRSRVDAAPDRVGSRVRAMLQAASRRPAIDYASARHEQALLRRHFDTLFERFDVILTPTTPIVASSVPVRDEGQLASVLTKYTGIMNLAGVPALTLPCGMSAEGLPIGMQVAGPEGMDWRVLTTGLAFQQVTSFHAARPHVATTAP
jgi:Asp-tRNA(Asn)/Glu-tRNA(Gln) amidotransferase A subunit family amidase